MRQEIRVDVGTRGLEHAVFMHRSEGVIMSAGTIKGKADNTTICTGHLSLDDTADFSRACEYRCWVLSMDGKLEEREIECVRIRVY